MGLNLFSCFARRFFFAIVFFCFPQVFFLQGFLFYSASVFRLFVWKPLNMFCHLFLLRSVFGATGLFFLQGCVCFCLGLCFFSCICVCFLQGVFLAMGFVFFFFARSSFFFLQVFFWRWTRLFVFFKGVCFVFSKGIVLFLKEKFFFFYFFAGAWVHFFFFEKVLVFLIEEVLDFMKGVLFFPCVLVFF